jgi:hypothetical protein
VAAAPLLSGCGRGETVKELDSTGDHFHILLIQNYVLYVHTIRSSHIDNIFQDAMRNSFLDWQKTSSDILGKALSRF